MKRPINLTEAELIGLRSGLNVLASAYREMAANEELPTERAGLSNVALAGEKLLDSLRGMPVEGEVQKWFDVADFSMLERAMRMAVAAQQRTIRLDMAPTLKAAIRAQIEETAKLLGKVRAVRGLPG